MQYIQPTGAAPNAAYVDANPLLGIEGSIVPAAAIESAQRELVALISGAGLTPSSGDLTQVLAAIRRMARGGAVRSVSASTTLTAADAGELVQVTASATITLPLGATMQAGQRIPVIAMTSATATVARQGGDLIYYKNGSTVTSLMLGSADTAELEWDGGKWMLVGGTAQLQYAAAFGATLGATGQQILPSGLILKWGPTPTVAGNSSASVTFSAAFPNAVYGWVPMGGKVATGQGSTLISGGLTVSGGTLTNTGANQVDAGVYLAWGR